MKHRWLCTAWLVAALFVPCAVAQNAVDPGADAETSALWPPGLADPGNMAAGVTDEFQEQSYRLWREGIIAGLEGDHPTTPGAVLLLAAAWAEDAELLDILLRHGAPLEDRDPVMGHSALHLAALDGLTSAVQLLAERGADTNTISTMSGATPLGDAVSLEHIDTARVLIDHGADINFQNVHSGAPVLQLAALDGRTTMTAMLLANGAKPNVPDWFGVTALHMTAINQHLDVARLLLEAGANPNVATQRGVTPLMVAQRQGWTAGAELMKRHGGREGLRIRGDINGDIDENVLWTPPDEDAASGE